MSRPELRRLTVPRLTRYVPHYPEPPQAAFLLLDCREAFYGGAAGGGKSDALLMAALQYVDCPEYSALILRRTFPELSLPGAIMDRAHDWLRPSDARWLETEKTWRFPSGATLSFGYLQHENDKYRYQGAEFDFVGFDELTQFTEHQYRYLFSRIRRLEGSVIPGRMRAASNPGGVGHEWVKARFIDGEGAVFIPARLSDNPHLDQAQYEGSLSELDPVTRQRLLMGDWEAREPGGYFDRTWFDRVPYEGLPPRGQGVKRVRYWDLAATEPTSDNPDPDWTVGLLLSHMGGVYFVEDVVRVREDPGYVEQLVGDTAADDGTGVSVRMEQEPGASGKSLIAYFRRGVLNGYDFDGKTSSGDKETRAKPASARASHREIKLLRAKWNQTFLDELEGFPLGHDDQVDALSGAYRELALGQGAVLQYSYLEGNAEPVRRTGDLVLVGEKYVDKER